MLYKLTDNEIRNLCKEKLESLEHWLRRIIDETLSNKFGDYFSYVDGSGNRLVANSIVQSLEKRVQKEPSRYKRKIDAVLLDDIVAIICNPQIYPYFRFALEGAFPEGASEAKTFLKRLTKPRNNLAHANPISLRQAERIVCYSNDVIDSLKAYYAALGMRQEYNVPLILKVTDSFGNVFFRNEEDRWRIRLDNSPRFFLRPGEILTAEVEVDSSFATEEYSIRWRALLTGQTLSDKQKMILHITERDVNQQFVISCQLTSSKSRHRLGSLGDDWLQLTYRILPPS